MNIVRKYQFVFVLYIAFVFIQSLFFKFTDSQRPSISSARSMTGLPRWVFTGVFAPGGIFSQYVIGSFELIASTALLASLLPVLRGIRPYAALLTLGVISGAIFFHLFTPLGVSVVNADGSRDGGELFALACGVWVSAAILILLNRDRLPFIGGARRPELLSTGAHAMHNFLADLLTMQMLTPVALVAALIVATFVLEDVATVAAGLLAGRMSIDPMIAVVAVIVGTVAGDLALYAAGRWLGGTAIAERLRARGSGTVEASLRRSGLAAVAVARFLPGTRLPVFFGSGVVSLPFAAVTATVVATTLVWTPALFFASSQAGATVFAALTPATVALAAGLLALVLWGPRLLTRYRATRALVA